jgi:CRP/FNR family transcriptional regulator, cyclic AMP receptor protein
MTDQALHRARQRLREVGRVKSFARAAELMVMGEHSREVLLIESGAVKVILSTEDGSTLIVGMYGPGELVGELGVLDNRPRSATVVGQRAGHAVHIPGRIFLELVNRDPNVRQFVDTTQRIRLDSADRFRLDLASKSVLIRIAAKLLDYGRAYGESVGGELVIRDLSQDDLASMVGAAKKSVERALKDLRVVNLVQTGRMLFVLPRPDLLESLLRQSDWRPGK